MLKTGPFRARKGLQNQSSLVIRWAFLSLTRTVDHFIVFSHFTVLKKIKTTILKVITVKATILVFQNLYNAH